MSDKVNQTKLLTEKIIGRYELVLDAPRLKGRGKVTVTTFGANETHSMVFNNETIGTFVNRRGVSQDEGWTYYGQDTLGRGNLLAGVLALQLMKVRLKVLAARRKRRAK
jgi:hypothetical protein